MKNFSIKSKLLLIVITTVIIVSTVIALLSIYSMNKLSDANIADYKKEAYLTKEKELENYVSIAIKTVEYFYQKAKSNNSNYSLTDAKKMALETISHIRYGKSGYLWVQDTSSKMIMHPIKESLNGKNLVNFKDKTGIYLFKELSSISVSKGGGLVKYNWEKPGKVELQQKFSYGKIFREWNWIIATGAYVDEIEEHIIIMEEIAEEEINLIILEIIGAAFIFAIIITLLVSLISNKYIVNPMNEFKDGLLNFFKYLNREKSEVSLL